MADNASDNLAGGTAVTPEEQEAVACLGLRSRARRWISELEEHFARDGNPVHACQAIDLANSYEIPMPEWLMTYLAAAMTEIMRILDAARAGEPILKEAELVGRAFGFGKGPGETGWFQQAALLEDEEQIFWDVVKATNPVIKTSGEKQYFVADEKLDMAYDIVAAEWGVDRSTVARAAARFLRRGRLKWAEDHAECISTMQEFVRGNLRAFNEGIEMLEAARRERDDGEKER
jgi:hypothetical protein